jgi:hypothetical protein
VAYGFSKGVFFYIMKMNIIELLMDKSNAREKAFTKDLNIKTSQLMGLMFFTLDKTLEPERIDRNLLNQLHIKSSEAEEFLDSAGALRNKYWYPFRKSVAVVKIFSQINYKLIHIRDSIQRYRLLPIEGDFVQDTDKALKISQEMLLRGCTESMEEGIKCKLVVPIGSILDINDNDIPFTHTLPNTRTVRHDTQPRTTIIHLATEFLGLSESNEIFECPKAMQNKNNLASFIPNPINTEAIRLLQTRFHNMQSVYDTYVSSTDLTQQDKNLTVLRGLISLIFHLLEIATNCAHYYQRHYSSVTGIHRSRFIQTKVNSGKDLPTLVYYCLIYADRYRKVGRSLCHQMLQQYAEIGTIEVSVPTYRGFHVRPSTLIAKIVLHYGSKVEMKLGEQTYNASLPLELFRANETINAIKRSSIFEMLESCDVYRRFVERFGTSVDTFFAYLPIQEDGVDATLRTKIGEMVPELLDSIPTMPATSPEAQQLYAQLIRLVAKDMLLELLESKKIIAYEPFFSFDDNTNEKGETLLEFMKRALTRYMALGKMDCSINVNVIFEGDTRVLEDLRILAHNGYGEDRFGNNIMLPKELRYLR